MSDFERPFYTIPEAAELLRVHENTLYNMVRRKELTHYKVGKQIRIVAAELEKLKVPAEPQENDAN
jgi:putative molybdopterin biosynthesis protein